MPIDPPDPRIRRLLALSTCNLSDALDRIHVDGAPRGILPLWHGCPRIAGPAVTMKLVPGRDASPVEGTLRTIGTGRPGDILVIDHGGNLDVNSFGGIAAYTAFHRGFAGVVIDGVTRDVDEMRPLGFAAYARGVHQQSIRNRCAFGGQGARVSCGGVEVNPGDWILADENGVVVIPATRLDEALEYATGKAAAEERIKRDIAQGRDPIEAHRAARYETPGDGRRRA